MKVLTVFGTRPEAIKMAPVVKALAEAPGVTGRVCVTAQHREMLDQVTKLFDITPDHDLDVMRPNQSLPLLTARLSEGLDRVITAERPDAILVQGDTTTAFVAALTGFYHKVPVGHVEAGLRTYDLSQPWPEEMNRQVVSRLAAWHFAPTTTARDNLRGERIDDARILVTGNTVIDALLYSAGRLDEDRALAAPLEQRFGDIGLQRKLVLVTAHRRESFGEPMARVCRAIAALARRTDVDIVFPVHPNPAVRQAVATELTAGANVRLIDPLDYLSFVFLMKRAHIILTDSGGVQEEAPSLGKPVLVMRDVTERVEAVEAGTVRLVGTDDREILAQATRLLDDGGAYDEMARARNPYGDGTAARRIVEFLHQQAAS